MVAVAIAVVDFHYYTATKSRARLLVASRTRKLVGTREGCNLRVVIVAQVYRILDNIIAQERDKLVGDNGATGNGRRAAT